MTYRELKYLTESLLIGDNSLPCDEQQMLALVSSGLQKIADTAFTLELLEDNYDVNTLRLGDGGYYVRQPRLPSNDDDKIDIEHELCFALARLIASYVSSEKGGIHKREAERIILDFNSKVDEIQQLGQNAVDRKGS